MSDFLPDRKSRLRNAWAVLKSYRTYLTGNAFRGVDRLLLFTGYPRSGHTLVGALLDAHPQVVIAHQAYALEYLKRGMAPERVFQLLVDNATRFLESGREWMGYKYHIPGQWQGKFSDLQLIGDKSGGITTRKLFEKGDFSQLDQIVERTGLRPVFVHVIRNPYDIITTMATRSMARRELPLTEADLLRKVDHFLKHAEGVGRLKAHGGFSVIDVYSEDLTADTEATLTALCAALGLSVNTDYLVACDNLVWDTSKQSRNTIDLWSADNVALVAKSLKAYPWFSRYTFTS